MNGRRFFLLFFLCALVPFAAAKLSLSYGWFNKGATNKGQWLARDVKLIPAVTTGDRHWSIAYVTAGRCEKNCLEAVGLLQQLYTGLGRKQLGAQVLLVTADQSNTGIIQQQFPSVKTMLVPFPVGDQSQAELLEEHFVIINQQGLVLLRYPHDGKKIMYLAADIRSDLLRLINYDRSRL